jgi:hypothetical protein
MSVRERTWINSNGQRSRAFVASWTGGDGRRHIKMFKRLQDAEAHHAMVNARLNDFDARHLLSARVATLIRALDNCGVKVARIDIAPDGVHRIVLWETGASVKVK